MSKRRRFLLGRGKSPLLRALVQAGIESPEVPAELAFAQLRRRAAECGTHLTEVLEASAHLSAE